MIYQVVMSVYFSVNFESVMSSVATLPNSPILINGVPLSSLVLAVSTPVLTIPLTQPSTPPPLPPQAPPPPPFNPIGLVIGVIGGLCGILICWCTYVRQKKKRQPQDAGTAEKHAKHAADATAEAATIAQEAAEQRRRAVAEAEAERERRAKEAREAAQVTLMTKVVVEWSSLKLLYEVDKGGVGTVWEASLDIAAGDGKVIAESLLSKGKAHLAAKADGSGDAGATKDVPAGRFARFARPVDAHADGLNARVLSEELVARQSHAALVEMTLALHALSPPERSHPNVLPILGIATDNGRRYALLTPKCTTSLQQLLHMAEQTLSLRLSLIAEWNNVACGIADGLKFLHGQRIAHAALHPGNVLLDAQMRPQLADYGPSMCRLRATYARTKEGRMKLQRRDDDAQGAEPLAGSESNLYLSPEILPSVGKVHLWSAARALDLPSDLWALGCLVARLATLKPLYYKERPAMLAALAHVSADERAAAARACISSGAWRPAAQLEGEAFLPLGLLELVAKCTSLRPTERPSSAQVHLALKRLYQEESEVVGAVEEYDVTVRPFRDAYRAVARIAPAPAPPRELERRRQKEDQMRTQFDLDGDGVITRAEVESVAGKNVSFDIRDLRRLLSVSDLNA